MSELQPIVVASNVAANGMKVEGTITFLPWDEAKERPWRAETIIDGTRLSTSHHKDRADAEREARKMQCCYLNEVHGYKPGDHVQVEIPEPNGNNLNATIWVNARFVEYTDNLPDDNFPQRLVVKGEGKYNGRTWDGASPNCVRPALKIKNAG
jgi:hypothetical protein